MLDFLNIDPAWILNYRTDALTTFFLSFSKYITYYFYMYVIAIGYWLSKENRPFIHLGFLFPFAVLVNSIIKGFLQIPRPDSSLHLIKTYAPYGFPSGDAFLATVFWLTLFTAWKNTKLRYLVFLPIIITSFSRIYLGAYGVYDVLGGLVLGILLVSIFHKPSVKNSIQRWYTQSSAHYWILTGLTTLAYVIVYRNNALDAFFFGFIGLLLGYGFAIHWIQERNDRSWSQYTIESYMNLIIAGIVLYSGVMYTNFSAISQIPEINFLCVALKYTLASFLIFAIVPKFIKPAKVKK